MKIITLANLAESTTQEVFDHVVAHARKQKVKSMVGSDCRYRDMKGNSCFAGCLMTDQEYISSGVKEGYTWEFMNIDANEDLISKLQYIHDMEMIYMWEDSFKNIAFEMNLKYSQP